LGLALLAATGAVADAGASACTRRHAWLPLPLELGDQRIEAIHRADVDTDGSLDLLLLVRNTLTLPYAELAPEVSHSILRVRFGPGPRFGSERIATGDPISEYLEHVWFYDADFDGDGTLDLLLHLDPRPDEAPSRIELFRGLGGGRFAPSEAFEFPEEWRVSAVGDFDGDGRNEFAILEQSVVRAYRYGAGTGWSLVLEVRLPFRFAKGAETADLDGDGDDDVVTRSTEDGTAFFVLLGDARNPLASWSPTFVGGYSNVRSILGRAGPGLPDVLVHVSVSGGTTAQLVAYRWDPAGPSLAWRWAVEIPLDASAAEPMQLDDDELEDIALRFNPGLWDGGPGYGYQLLLSRPDAAPIVGERSQGQPGLVDARDLDGDGVRDAVLLPAPSGYGLVWYRGLPGPRFAEPDRYREPFGPWPTQLFPGDLDADGTLDLLASLRPLPDEYVRSFLGRGDGTFEPGAVTSIIGANWGQLLHDLDDDGLPDLLVLPADDPPSGYGTETMVHYGRGDGRFGAAVDLPHLTGGKMWAYTGWLFGDLDGDGDDDAMPRIPEWGLPDEMSRPLFVDGREMRYGPQGLERRGPTGQVRALVDVDGDGRADPAYVLHPSPTDPAKDALVWRRTTETGHFEAERVLLEWGPSDHELSMFARADLDRVEPGEELLVQLQKRDAVLTITLTGTGREGHRVLWHGEATGPGANTLMDADLDGRLDLVTTRSGFHVVPGDGRGGFLLRRAQRWYGEPEAIVQDFTSDAHPALLANFSLGTESRSALSVNEGLVLESDAGPPEVEILLDPVFAGFEPPLGFQNTWRVTTLAEDDCTAAPEILARRIDWAPVPPGAARRFRTASGPEIRVYERPGGAISTIVLLGPAESEARALLARIEREGGASIERVEVLDLLARDEYGARAVDLGDAALAGKYDRLARRLVFRGPQLIGASVTRPGGDLTISARARDEAGNESAATVSVRAAEGALSADH
jgi:hypothetical protein